MVIQFCQVLKSILPSKSSKHPSDHLPPALYIKKNHSNNVTMEPLPIQSSSEDDCSEDGLAQPLPSATAQAEDAIIPEADTTFKGSSSSCQVSYLMAGYSKPLLVLPCLGLTKKGDNDNSPLFDLESPPWNAKKHTKLKPKQADFVNETLRRQACRPVLYQHKDFLVMKPKNKTRQKLIDFLVRFPVTDPDCILFLKTEVNRLEGVFKRATEEADLFKLTTESNAAPTGSPGTASWTGPVPYLRLLHCIIDCDATREAFLRRNDVMDRQELDARNSPSRPDTGYERIAKKWNDPTFNPATCVSLCHVDFAVRIDLSHTRVASLTPADATMVKNRLSALRAKLLGVISRWETSGQGDGGRHNEENEDNDMELQNEGEDEGEDDVVVPLFVSGISIPGSVSATDKDGWGTLEGRPQCALDSRENFLQGNPSWYLYFWEMADTYQLLDSTMQRLNSKVGLANGAQGTTTVHSKNKRKFNTSGISIAETDIDSATGYLSVQEKTMGRINVLLDHLSDTNESDLGLRQETVRLGLESLDERRKDRHQEKELALQSQMQEKELAIRRRIDNVNDSINDLQMKLLMDTNMGESRKIGVEKVIAKKQEEVQRLEAELVSLKQTN